MSDIIKCKFCGWTCKKGWKNKDGKYTSGQSFLMDHIMLRHQNEYFKLQEQLDDDLTLREPND